MFSSDSGVAEPCSDGQDSIETIAYVTLQSVKLVTDCTLVSMLFPYRFNNQKKNVNSLIIEYVFNI